MRTPAIHIHQRVVAAFVDAVDGKARGAQVVCQHVADDVVTRQDAGGRLLRAGCPRRCRCRRRMSARRSARLARCGRYSKLKARCLKLPNIIDAARAKAGRPRANGVAGVP